MGKVLGWIAGVLAVAIIAVLGFAATRPDTFRVERSITVKAPPERIFALIEDFRRWPAWSPYEKLDPAMKRTYAGPSHGAGSTYGWESGKAGVGRMEITQATPSRVSLNLDFTKPFPAHNRVDFSLVPQGDTTKVTWAMQGPMPFVSKVMCLFVDMDRMVGGDFEKGLAAMKTAAEAEA